MRNVVVLLALVACSAPERTPTRPWPDREVGRARAEPAQADAAPGLRLPDGVTPLHYELTLDVAPESETFSGDVRIRIRIDRALDRIWIHAAELDITSARLDDVALTTPPARGDQMLGFAVGRTLQPGEHVLAFSYTGRTTGDQEGLFRQRAGDHWYLFSQGEAVFARRMVPCFDEPKFKTPWRVTLVVPKPLVALANTPEESVTAEGARKRVRFAETPVMPSYLLAVAVGPFDLVDAGTVGTRKIPVRVAVRAGAARQATIVGSKLPAIVTAMEAYVGEPLPVAKLDFVAVPQFFGAMENPGLITAEASMLVGKETKQRVAYFTHVAAHELAHQWFGNSVTPAWWDDLWLSESFASWLGDKISSKLGAFADRPLEAVVERREAVEADTGPGALPLHRRIEGNRDPDDAFDAIAYQKGKAVLATFEALVGEDAFRAVVRAYLTAHRDHSVTMQAFVSALARATTPDIGAAFEQYAMRAGVPVVDLSLRCDGAASLAATARGDRLVPICVRHAGAPTPACALAGSKTEIALGRACPAWITGNALAGYYHVHWQSRSATQNLAQLDVASRAIIGDDLAAAFARGELPAKDALAALHALLASDVDTQLAAIPLAKQIDDLVDEATRPAWSAWLARRIPSLRSGNHTPSRVEVFRELTALLQPADQVPPPKRHEVRKAVDRQLSKDVLPYPQPLAIAAITDGAALFDRIVDKALATKDREKREQWLRLLGVFPADHAERVAALAVDRAELPIEPIWDALEHYIDRPATRRAGWAALRTHLDTFMKHASHRGDEMIDAAGWLCDGTSRAEVEKAFTPHLGRIEGGRTHLDLALAAIDQCIARRARVGDLAAAITSSR